MYMCWYTGQTYVCASVKLIMCKLLKSLYFAKRSLKSTVGTRSCRVLAKPHDEMLCF
jgi:hypothetical protein